MIKTVKIENFKSIPNLELELGRVTVLIGANGSGKSNILESIAFGSGATSNKLDNEFLSSRGIRVASNRRMMMSAFSNQDRVDTDDALSKIGFHVSTDSDKWISYFLFSTKFKHGDRWNIERYFSDADARRKIFERATINVEGRFSVSEEALQEAIDTFFLESELERFLIYAPENRELRTFAEEGQILPLGIRGEGLFRLLKILSEQNDGETLQVLKEKLQVIDWFEDFEFPTNPMPYERGLRIRDRHLDETISYFDQHSANEGFLFLLFYYCLFLSEDTPPFFAVDNIDSSLNPRLCERLMLDIAQLSKDNDKQVILTTHNAAILDGLDLNDPEQILYSVRRNRSGATIVERILPPKVKEGQSPVRLSEAYLRGYLGGLPNNF